MENAGLLKVEEFDRLMQGVAHRETPETNTLDPFGSPRALRSVILKYLDTIIVYKQSYRPAKDMLSLEDVHSVIGVLERNEDSIDLSEPCWPERLGVNCYKFLEFVNYIYYAEQKSYNYFNVEVYEYCVHNIWFNFVNLCHIKNIQQWFESIDLTVVKLAKYFSATKVAQVRFDTTLFRNQLMVLEEGPLPTEVLFATPDSFKHELITFLKVLSKKNAKPTVSDSISSKEACELIKILSFERFINLTGDEWQNADKCLVIKLLDISTVVYKLQQNMSDKQKFNYYMDFIRDKNNFNYDILAYIRGIDSWFVSVDFSDISWAHAFSKNKLGRIMMDIEYFKSEKSLGQSTLDSWRLSKAKHTDQPDSAEVPPLDQQFSDPSCPSCDSASASTKKPSSKTLDSDTTITTDKLNVDKDSSSTDDETEEELETGTVESLNHSSLIDEERLIADRDMLASIFPNIPGIHIALILENSKGEMAEASDMCLSYEFLKLDLEKQALSKKFGLVEKKKEVLLEKKSKKQDVAESAAMEEDVRTTANRLEKADKVYEMLSLDSDHQDKVLFFLKRNKDQIYNTILDILINWRKDKGVEDQGNRKLHETLLPNTSNTGVTYAQSLMSDLSKNIKIEKLDLVREYMNNSDWKILAEYIKSNPQSKLPSNFYINALVWFNFDVVNVLCLANSLADEVKNKGKGVKITRNEMFKFVVDNQNAANSSPILSDEEFEFQVPDKRARRQKMQALQSSIQNTRAQISYESNKLVKGHYFSQLSKLKSEARELREHDQDELYNRMRRVAETESRIDLHSFTVKTAMDLLDDVLPMWWEDELSQRQLSGGSGKKAQHLPPFEIITGKGIHSCNGPVLQKAVSRYLKDGNWIFNDNSGSFVVLGKRR